MQRSFHVYHAGLKRCVELRGEDIESGYPRYECECSAVYRIIYHVHRVGLAVCKRDEYVGYKVKGRWTSRFWKAGTSPSDVQPRFRQRFFGRTYPSHGERYGCIYLVLCSGAYNTCYAWYIEVGHCLTERLFVRTPFDLYSHKIRPMPVIGHGILHRAKNVLLFWRP